MILLLAAPFFPQAVIKHVNVMACCYVMSDKVKREDSSSKQRRRERKKKEKNILSSVVLHQCWWRLLIFCLHFFPNFFVLHLCILYLFYFFLELKSCWVEWCAAWTTQPRRVKRWAWERGKNISTFYILAKRLVLISFMILLSFFRPVFFCLLLMRIRVACTGCNVCT